MPDRIESERSPHDDHVSISMSTAFSEKRRCLCWTKKAISLFIKDRLDWLVASRMSENTGRLTVCRVENHFILDCKTEGSNSNSYYSLS
jgi:hypothetical protein